MHRSCEPKLADYHHAPLQKRSWDTKSVTVEDGVEYWIANGLAAANINLGIPLYTGAAENYHLEPRPLLPQPAVVEQLELLVHLTR